jgi:hypothetical protein
MSSLFPWLSRPPTIAAIVVAIVLVMAGRFVSGEQILVWLTSITLYLRQSLESFDALHVARTFYAELTGCHMLWTPSGFEMNCAPGLDTLDHLGGKSEPHPLIALIMAVFNTIGSLWSGSTWLGLIFYAFALVASGVALAAIMKPEDEPVLWLIWLLLIPAAGGMIALLLKWVLLLFVLIFSEALAGIVWIIATFGTAIVWLRSVLDTAHNVDAVVAGTAASAAPPKDTSTPK